MPHWLASSQAERDVFVRSTGFHVFAEAIEAEPVPLPSSELPYCVWPREAESVVRLPGDIRVAA